MLRRKPTRIELKLDDIEEWNELRRAADSQKSSSTAAPFTPVAGGDKQPSDATKKDKRDVIHQRIGYNPLPVVEPSTSLPTAQQ